MKDLMKEALLFWWSARRVLRGAGAGLARVRVGDGAGRVLGFDDFGNGGWVCAGAELGRGRERSGWLGEFGLEVRADVDVAGAAVAASFLC